MAEKFNDFSTDELMALARSPAGRQLLTLLQQTDGGQLQQAAGMAAAGDLAGAKEVLAPLLSDPRIRAMLDQLGGP